MIGFVFTLSNNFSNVRIIMSLYWILGDIGGYREPLVVPHYTIPSTALSANLIHSLFYGMVGCSADKVPTIHYHRNIIPIHHYMSRCAGPFRH